MGHSERPWQDAGYVLNLFAKQVPAARRRYRAFVEKGVDQGRRPELIGGGLLRSLGGWQAVKTMRAAGQRTKGEERILGDTDFIDRVLAASNDALERKAVYRSQGYDFDWLVKRVAELLAMDVGDVLKRGRYPQTVKARSILLYWAPPRVRYPHHGIGPANEPIAAGSQPFGGTGRKACPRKRIYLVGPFIIIYEWTSRQFFLPTSPPLFNKS